MEPISRNLLPTNSLEVPFLTVKQEGLILQVCVGASEMDLRK